VFLRPEEAAGACAPLLRQALGLTGSFWAAARGHGEVRAVVLSAAAARLPGLLGALEDRLDRRVVPLADDLADDAGRPPRVRVLDAEAVAGAVHDLARRVCLGELAAGQIEAAPLLASAEVARPLVARPRGLAQSVRTGRETKSRGLRG